MTRFSIAALLVLAACSPDSSEAPSDAAEQVAEEATREATSALEGLDLEGVSVGTELGPTVESIVTRDGSMELGFTSDVLYLRLSEATQKEVAQEMDRKTEDVEGLGGQIARAVTNAVESGLKMATQIPLTEIEDIRVEDGRLVIVMVDGEPSPFVTSKTDGEPLLEAFALEDADRLAESFSTRQ